MKYFEATDSNGVEEYLIPLENGLFIAVPKEQIEEKQTMSDDLIKRSDAIEAITNHCENECYYRADNWCPQCQREEFEEAINAVPSADRPQGEWVFVESKISDKKLKKCSACGLGYVSLKPDNYCPNCGARMKGADDE